MLRLALGLVVAASGCGDDGGTRATTDSDSTTSPVTTPSSTLPLPSASASGTSGDMTETSISTGTDTGEEESEVSTTEGPAVCPADTHLCLAEAPKGWEGPGMVLAGDAAQDEPDCDDIYPEGGGLGFEALDAPDAECACSCGEPKGTECDNSTTLRYWGDSLECNEGSATQFTIFTIICNNLPTPFSGDRYWQVDVIEASGGACVPIDDEVIEDPAWQTQVVGCAGAEFIEGCELGELCAPKAEAEDAQMCVWRTGEHECPAGYDVPRPLYTDVTDGRGCQPCSCGEPVGVCDDAAATQFFNLNCQVPFANIFDANGECSEGSSVDVRSVLLSTGSPSAFCTANEAMPVGEAIGIDPVTVCCAG